MTRVSAGIALDHSTSFPNHPCGPDKKERNYTICFATFSVLMGAALITATQINFKYEEAGASSRNRAPSVDHDMVLSKEDQMQAQLAEQLNLPSLADTRAEVGSAPKEQKVSSSCAKLGDSDVEDGCRVKSSRRPSGKCPNG